jgi:hypothetical protein
MNNTVIGIFSDDDAAESAITELRGMGITDSDISYVSTNSRGKIVTEDGSGTHVSDGAAKGATTGGIIGAVAGLAVANGVLPGLGTLFVAGPIATALGLSGAAATTAAGALTGAAAGGLVGALTGLGVDKDQATVYEERVKNGDVLVTVHTSSPEQASEVLSNHGADEVKEYSHS